MLESDTYTALIKTIERDCRVLESFKIMDYSLLVVIHNLDLAAKIESKLPGNSSINEGSGAVVAGTSLGAAKTPQSTKLIRNASSINHRKLVAHSTALESIQMEYGPIGKEDYIP